MRFLVFTIASLLLLSAACKSNVENVMDWYEDTGPSIRRGLPSVSECDRWRGRYWIMVREIERTTDQFTHQQVQMSPYVPPEVRQDLARVFSQTIDSMYQAFLSYPGWTERQSKYCEGRYNAERQPDDACAGYSMFSVQLMGESTWHYGIVGYCIEHFIPPFE